MIKINLLGDTTADDNTAKLQIIGYVASLILCLGIFYLLQSSINTSVQEMTDKTQDLKNELARYQKITKEVKDLETKKAEYNSKLAVIATLKKNKLGPVRILDDLNIALPEKAWITEMREESGTLQIIGQSLDEQTAASFIRALEKSDYFGEGSNEILKLVDKDGVKIREFSFKTPISYAGSAVMQVDIENTEAAASVASTPAKK